MITFKNISAESLGVVFEALPSIPVGSPRHEYVVVPGRDGSLTISDDSMEDIVITLEGNAIESNRKALSGWLSGFGRLVFNDQPDRFLEARISEEILIKEEVRDEQVLHVSVTFRCKPYFHLNSGQTASTVSGKSITLQNQGNMVAYPKVKINGNGDVILKQSGAIIMTIKDVMEYVEIDSEADLVHKGTELKEHDSTGEVPVLGLGQTTLTCEGEVTSIEVIPRWRIR